MSKATMWEEFLGGEIRYYQAGSIRTRCLEAGSGEPLIMLHGNGGHGEIFIRNIMPLARHFRVYALDMLGHGFTDKPDIDYFIPDYVKHVLSFMQAANLERANFIGHALAGWIATYLTVHHPARVTKLVNINGLTHLKESDKEAEAGFEQIRTLSTSATAQPTPESVRKRLEFVLADPERLTDEMVAVRYAIYNQLDTARAMSKIIQVESAAQRKYGLTAAQLQGIRIPVLLIFAEKHPLEKLANFKTTQELITDSRLHVMENAGILGMWEKPEEFNQVVLDFLSAPSF